MSRACPRRCMCQVRVKQDNVGGETGLRSGVSSVHGRISCSSHLPSTRAPCLTHQHNSSRTQQAIPDNDPELTAGLRAQARRLIVFVVGPVTHSETRVVRKLSGKLNRDIILGGTSVVTPAAFLQSMRELCIGALIELKHSK